MYKATHQHRVGLRPDARNHKAQATTTRAHAARQSARTVAPASGDRVNDDAGRRHHRGSHRSSQKAAPPRSCRVSTKKKTRMACSSSTSPAQDQRQRQHPRSRRRASRTAPCERRTIISVHGASSLNSLAVFGSSLEREQPRQVSRSALSTTSPRRARRTRHSDARASTGGRHRLGRRARLGRGDAGAGPGSTPAARPRRRRRTTTGRRRVAAGAFTRAPAPDAAPAPPPGRAPAPTPTRSVRAALRPRPTPTGCRHRPAW